MTQRRRNARVGLALVVAGALLLTGCGGNSREPGDATTASRSTTRSPSDAATGRIITAVEKEFSIDLSEASLSPGTYTFEVENEGSLPHDLTIKGPGVDDKATATLQGGQSGQITVTLQAGSYTLWCSIDGHRAQGMEATVRVA